MSDRYTNRTPMLNDNRLYERHLINKQVPHIIQYQSPIIRYPSDADINQLDIIERIWGQGDRFFKYAAEYYGDPGYWWIIPWFNQKPLESDFKHGDVVHIPMPLDDVVMYVE